MVEQSWTSVYKSWVGRKMIIFYLALISLTSLTFAGKLSGMEFIIGLSIASGSSVAGNILTKKIYEKDEKTG